MTTVNESETISDLAASSLVNEIAQLIYKRGADIVKVITPSDTEEDSSELEAEDFEDFLEDFLFGDSDFVEIDDLKSFVQEKLLLVIEQKLEQRFNKDSCCHELGRGRPVNPWSFEPNSPLRAFHGFGKNDSEEC